MKEVHLKHPAKHIAQVGVKASNPLECGKRKSESLNKSLKSDLICLKARMRLKLKLLEIRTLYTVAPLLGTAIKKGTDIFCQRMNISKTASEHIAQAAIYGGS